MLDDEPIWKFKSKQRFTEWYGHVQLLENDVVGQWLCVDRGSGNLKWRRRHYRASSVCGIERGVIVAYEGEAGRGVYGLSLETGELLWVSHGAGFWNTLGRFLDFVPGYTNEFRDSPLLVKDGKVFCHSGRVLDITTGKLLEQRSRDEIEAMKVPESNASTLDNSSSDPAARKARVGNLFLWHPTLWKVAGECAIVADTEHGDRVWEFDIRDHQRHIGGNFYSYRLSGSFVYLIVSEEKRSKPHPRKEHYSIPNPTRWAIWTLDALTGKVVQEISLGDELIEQCRIEDVDDRGLLIGTSMHELLYFRKH